MATYTKPLKSMEITLIGGGDAISVADTASKPYASQALAQFLAEQIMVIPEQEGATLYIPFHAVAVVAVTTQSSDEMSRDPYGCEEDGGSDGGSGGGSNDDAN